MVHFIYICVNINCVSLRSFAVNCMTYMVGEVRVNLSAVVYL